MIRALTAGHGIGGGDLEVMYQPFWSYVGQSVRHGRLPLWDPDIGVGLPILASLQSQSLYLPATVLFTLLPLHAAAFVFLFGHCYFAGFGTERLARRLGWSETSAACAGALIAGAPMMLASITSPNRLAAAAWLPWTLLAGERVCARRRGGIAALAVCVGLGLLCGQPEVTLIWVLMVGAYAVFRTTRGDRAAVPLCLLAGVLGVALAAVVLVPFAELLHRSTHGVEISGLEGAWSFGRGDLASLVLPFLSMGLPENDFREIFFGAYQRLFSVLYLGAPAVLLCAVALRRGRRREWLLFSVAVLALLVGAYGGQISVALERLHLGLISWRYPVKLIYPAAFVAALLAARGAEEIAEARPKARTLAALFVVGLALSLGAIAGLRRFGNPLALSLGWVGGGVVVLTAILRWAPRGPWRQWTLIAFCLADASLCSLRIPFADTSSKCGSLFDAARPRVGAGRLDAISGAPMANGTGFATREPGWQSYCLEGNIAAQFGLPSVRFYGTPVPPGSMGLVDRTDSIGDGLLGVTLLLRGHAADMRGVTPVSAAELAPLWAAELPETAPRVELRPIARVTDDLLSALDHETLAQARQEVLLDAEPPQPTAPGEPYAGGDQARLVADRGEQVEIETASAAERYLVLADLYYRGWTATVDGQAAPVRVAYGVLRTVRLGPGRHRVLFEYRPASFRVGLAITSLSALALALGTLVARKRALA
jgi:hypothetical protein